jgi:L,D-transpeptidase ErfK/SrfK
MDNLFRIFGLILLASLLVWSSSALAARYGERLCEYKNFECYEMRRGDTWEELWPDPNERELVKRLNRMNIRLQPGMVIAEPRNVGMLSIMDISPFPHFIEAPGRTLIIFDPKVNAWGAYDAEGALVRWGPASGGQNWCSDTGQRCLTPAGKFSMQSAQGPNCISSKFPIPYGGAPMPYCMFFNRGYAFHGSFIVPGYNASHGCVRTFVEDARWLRKEFIELPRAENDYKGTLVIVRPYK